MAREDILKKRILVVEDEPDFAKAVHIILETNNYEVIVAADGQEALEKAKQTPDLILLDIMLPKLDGFEVAQRLKANPQTKSIPIIMLTVHSEPEITEKSIEAGAVDYIVKSFNPMVLLNKVKKVLSQ